MIENIKQIVDTAERIVILQADNPDADSLGSALALEQILETLGKKVYLYCSVEPPTYLRYTEGWDRVLTELPSNFDASIIVDASTLVLFENLKAAGQLGWLRTKPCIVIDHHETTDNSIDFATAIINDPLRSATGELIFDIAKKIGWQLDAGSAAHLMNAILGDTQGLTNELTTADTFRIMAELTDLGANRPQLEEARRELGKMDPKIFRYKAELINKTELLLDGRLAIVTVPQVEINEYSPLYNPAPLIQGDILQTKGVKVAIVLKSYDSGRILASIRATGAPIAGKLAEGFGGGGHAYAAGFKIESGKSLSEIKSACTDAALNLLNNLENH